MEIIKRPSIKESRLILESQINSKFKELNKFIEDNKPLFDDLEDFILRNEGEYSKSDPSVKLTHYFHLLKFYHHQFQIFETKMLVGKFLSDLDKPFEEINSFISTSLAEVIVDLYDERTNSMTLVYEADVTGRFNILKDVIDWENKAYSKLGFINRAVDYLAIAIKNFNEVY